MNRNPTQRYLLHLELAKLLAAGFGIRQAIAAILKSKPPADQAAVLAEVDGAIGAGKSIAEAFGGSSGITDLERVIIGAGERGGRLAQSFQHLADYYELLAQVRRDAGRAMIQPVILMHIGLFLATVPMGLVAGKEWGEVLVSAVISLVVLYICLFLLWLLARAALRAAPGSATIDSLINRIPTVGAARRALAMARFTRVYHTGLLAGLPMRETVQISLDASRSGILRDSGRNLVAAAEAGGPLGPAFTGSAAFPDAFSRSYETAEEAGGLDLDMERWARYFQNDALHRVKVAAATIPRVIYVMIVAFIAWKIISFFLGYYSMLDHIGDDGSEPMGD